jgi:hypothetical protein
MKIFFNKYLHWNKYNVDSDDNGGDVFFNFQTPSEYHHLSDIFMLLYK